MTLSQQTKKSPVSQRRAPKELSQVSSEEIEKYQTIGQASCQVYEALGKACSKHTEHQTHFCVEVEQELIHEVYESRLKFKMAFTHINLAGSAQQDDLLWFVVNSITDDDATKQGSEVIVNSTSNNHAQSPEGQVEPPRITATKKQQKASQIPTLNTTTTTITAANAVPRSRFYL